MKKRTLILSLILATISLNVATVSMSIAWYSSGISLDIEPIDISLDCNKELKISKTIDGDYEDSISFDEEDSNGLFMPVTSAYSKDWIETKNQKPIFYDDSNPISSNVQETSKKATSIGYFSQSIYLLSDDDVYVTVKSKGTHISPNEVYNVDYAHKLYEEIQSHEEHQLKHLSEEEIYDRLNKINQAMRFSILSVDEDDYSYAVIDPNKSGDTYYGGLLDNDIDEYYDYYCLQDETKYERVYGDILNRNKIVYDEESMTDSEYLDKTQENNAFNAKHKAGVKLFNLEKSLQNGVEIKKEQSFALTDFNDDRSDNPYHFKLKANQPKEVVVSIYIEGWDEQSVNYTMGASFLASLSFKIEREY